MSVLTALATFLPVLDSLPAPLIILDGDGRIVFINRQTEELFGYTRGDLVGQTLEVLVSERFRQGVRDYLRACIDDPTVATRRGVEVRALRRDSTDLPASAHVSQFQAHDGAFTLAIVHDSSERGVVEQALRASEGALWQARRAVARSDLHRRSRRERGVCQSDGCRTVRY